MDKEYAILDLKYSKIDDLLAKGKNYINVIMGYCESKIDSSEAVADIYMIISELKEIHELLFESIDEIMTDLQ